eukprot:6339105-Alexandrium_andersonii.AAC.1
MFFSNSDNAIKQKLIVNSAVVRSKLMYGLASAALNSTSLRKLDAFQMCGGIPTRRCIAGPIGRQ